MQQFRSRLQRWFSPVTVGLRRQRSSATPTETLECRILPAINIVYDYTYDTGNFFTAERRVVMEAAARLFEDAFSDSLAAITPSGSNSWSASFTNPTTGSSVSLTNPTIPANQIRIYLGARTLTGSTVGFASTGYSWSGTLAWGNAVQYRGQSAVSTETAPWGGSITFNSSTSWHSGLTTTGLTGSLTDLYSVAVHEIAHIMGIAAGHPAWAANINGSGNFVGPNALAVAGAGGIPTTGGHFADGTTSDGQEVAMAPAHLTGNRHHMTSYDWAAMDDIGWTLTFNEAAAAPKTGHLTVRVVNSGGTAVSGATVALTSVSGSGTANLSSGSTDSFGLFSTFVTGGDWDISVNGQVLQRVSMAGLGQQLQLVDSPPPPPPVARDDIFGWDSVTGQWRIGQSDGSSFGNRVSTAWSPSAGWTMLSGDFNGDGRTDVAGLAATGHWYVGLSDGTNFVTSFWLRWGAVATTGWKNFLVGDFNNDGRDDIAAQSAAGDWWVALSTGTSFTTSNWGRWSGSWTKFVTGDFNGDGRADIAGLDTAGGWHFGLSSGTAFPQTRAGTWNATAGWTDIQVGDFNGDGRSDIFGRTASGFWYIARSNGTSITNVLGVRWTQGETWLDVNVADFDGDGRADVAGRDSQGFWNVALSDGTKLINTSWGRWNAAVNWVVVVGDFNGDGRADIAGRNPNDGRWWVAVAQPNFRFVTSLFGNWGTTSSNILFNRSRDVA
jgi:hypothetical protein